ncbi:prenyltransferase [Loigolactobacillus backii]|uniref:1,4-dihydroxy-2-naphthoate prenyltransferase n=1 Tax=Loigolactobacillus backii TaxID=375175 RepID=A0A192GYW9_9LACO|nr:prenyltransferase [Loigolactobacillus backii]ANK59052.1 1,4-dihydroxy-2-naphthoate prenyltransferase [Loigolactobacillus backii]ANK61280.1 1,4-dihydroxy-2-naphthoate prenyltransferase [Loigolactobacillus backii]ANK64041.1 1,4-dihydroxy-2-naphthoate prenyltransferase [Loigolactobacillus backii]ANK69520.1 1,4-dihydroxy-2-naphthoate prenyltransferase [Loigolactobacillus backii]MDA5387967.1 prenyltransferase [Loigolactobacillus backii]
MTLSVFLELVEIKAKTASVFPFLLGTFYALYHYRQLHPVYLVLFFIAMLVFNMAVDANDNYQDYRRATKNEALGFREKTNIIGVNHLNPRMIGWLVFWMMASSAVLGIFIASQTGWPVLWLGLFCYAVGYFYAGGPRPISTTPFGELFSGLTMGFVIFLLSVYLNTYEVVTFNWAFVGPILLSSGLAVCAISNLMLANNISDQKEDLELGRHTILVYIGKKNALRLFVALYVIGFLTLIVAVIVGYLPKLTLLTLVTVPIVWKNTRLFLAKQIKKETFPLAVKNLFLTTLAQVIFFGLGVWLNF